MTFDRVIIRYGELSLKGKNRRFFIERLHENTRKRLKSFPDVILKRSFDRMFVHLNGQPYPPVIRTLQEVFGIQRLSVAVRTESELEAIQKGALVTMHEVEDAKTFKISAKRMDKNFPIHSQQLNTRVGGYVLKHGDGLKVDVHHPDVELKIEVDKKDTYISGIDFPGAGGLPVGVGGKVMLMLSGGIDSPVAGYLSFKRGVRIEAVHFHSPPYTSERAKQKVEDICHRLTVFGGTVNLHVVPFTEVQESINGHIPDSYRMTIMRRMMLRIAEQLAHRREALAITTGENLGQVASQTLESLNTINEVTTLPVFRPVLTMDKLEMIGIAKKIGTYEISIRPYEDCCTIFVPAAPKTKPTRVQARNFEKNLPIEELLQKAVDGTQMFTFDQDHSIEKEFQSFF